MISDSFLLKFLLKNIFCLGLILIMSEPCMAVIPFAFWRQSTSPGSDWATISVGGLAVREYHSAVWTGTKMIVWGGFDNSSTYFSDGASYTPP